MHTERPTHPADTADVRPRTEEAGVTDDEIRAALAELGAATLGEAGGLAADRRLRPAWPGAALAAPAYPVGCTPG